MNDYISREAAIEETWNEPMYSDPINVLTEMRDRIKALPSADVVEVVRCKDCRWGREVCGNIECFTDINVPPEYHGYEWFCPNGERRTDGEIH